jgi:hypothetical protein
MRPSRYWLLFGLGLLVAIGIATLQDTPGYMDADYYFYGGVRLADGYGFTEMVLWNFLDDPTGLPHPSHTYWMPFTSIIAAIGITLFRFLGDFSAAQVGFVLIFALIPPLTAALCMRLTQEERKAMYAGVLSLFSGYFLPVSTTTDSFGPYLFLGGMFFLLLQKEARRRFLGLGLISGLMHLTRSDGILWLLVAGVVWLVDVDTKGVDAKMRMKVLFSRKHLLQAGELLLGYFVVMAFWYLRNVRFYGTLFPLGGGQTLWLLDYDELFSYPPGVLTLDRWWASGLGEIIRVRAQALWLNLLSGLAVQGLIALGPVAFIGAWHKRDVKIVRMGWVAWCLVLGVMTILFPYAGFRGGFFHSGAAFMPLIWALVPVGLDRLSKWTVKHFNWEVRKISPFFHGVLALFTFLFSVFLVSMKFFGVDSTSEGGWGTDARSYQALEERLRSLGASPDEIVLVNNPPGYAHVSGRPAIVIPNGDVGTLKLVIERYQPSYVLLGFNHPQGLDGLYEYPENQVGLTYLETVADTHIFIIDQGGP